MKKTRSQKILNYLKSVEEAPASVIADKTGVPYYVTKFMLNDMVKNGYITFRKSNFGTYTYYKFNNPIKETEKLNKEVIKND